MCSVYVVADFSISRSLKKQRALELVLRASALSSWLVGLERRCSNGEAVVVSLPFITVYLSQSDYFVASAVDGKKKRREE